MNRGKYFDWVIIFIGMFGAVLGIIADFQPVWTAIKYLLNLNYYGLFILTVILIVCFAFLLYYASKPLAAPRFARYLFVLGALCGIILAMQSEDNVDRKYIIVYDDYTPSFHPEIIKNIETIKLTELHKLQMVKQLDDETVLISAVERPELRWPQAFPNGFKSNAPVFSLHQIIQPDTTGITDLSLSDFKEEIKSFIEELPSDSSEIRIFFEYGYEEAERQLRRTLLRDNINSILYDSEKRVTLLDTQAIIIFLGSPLGLKNFASNFSTSAHGTLIVPSWLRPNISYNKSNVSGTTSRVCVVSSVMDDLAKKDMETWGKYIEIIDKENITSGSPALYDHLKNKVRSHFATNNRIININF